MLTQKIVRTLRAGSFLELCKQQTLPASSTPVAERSAAEVGLIMHLFVVVLILRELVVGDCRITEFDVVASSV